MIETIQKIRSAEPAPPRKFQMSIPVAFESVVLKMLAKAPTARQLSASALLDELKRVAKYQRF